MNVLYLIRSWAIGGSHTIIRTLLRHLPKQEFNIITAVYDAPGGADERFAGMLRAEGHAVADERIPWRNRRQWRAAQQCIAGLIAQYRIDLLHCHDTHSNVLVGLGRQQWQCARVASPYGWWEPWWHLQARANHWIEKYLALPRFDAVHTVSQDMKRKILRGPTPAERIRVIHTGIDLHFLESDSTRAEMRRQLGFSEDDFIIGTVSRLEREKGHAVLLAAAAMLRPRIPNLKVLIVGMGRLKSALEKQARAAGLADCVRFTGYVDDVAAAMRAMDLFMLPSIDHEGFPTVVLEAQACGVPVVASRIGGTAETLDEQRTGLLVPPASPLALAEAIASLHDNPQKRAAMAAAARPWIESQFTLEDMIAQIADLYRTTLAAHRHLQ